MNREMNGKRNSLWINEASDRLGVDAAERWIRQRIGIFEANADRRVGPYLLVGSIVIITNYLLPVFGYLKTGSYLPLENPATLFSLPIWLLVVYTTRRLNDRYWTAIDDLPEPATEIDDEDIKGQGRLHPIIGLFLPTDYDESIGRSFPSKHKLIFLIFGWIYHFGWILLDPTAGQYVRSQAGVLVTVVQFGIVTPFVFYPLVVDFVGVLLSIHILFPYDITRRNLIDFSDQHGYGGLRVVGELSKTSTVTYFVLFSIYVGYVGLTRGVGPSEPTHLVLLIGTVIFGIAIFLVPIFWVGTHMQLLKRAKIDHIVGNTRELGRDDSVFPMTEAESAEDASRYAHEYAKLSTVKDMKNYPVDIFSIRDLFYALPLPIVINFATVYTSNVLGI